MRDAAVKYELTWAGADLLRRTGAGFSGDSGQKISR